MEMQKLRNELDNLKRPKKLEQPIEKFDTIKEEAVVVNNKKPPVVEVEKVNQPKTVINTIPIKKSIRKNIANGGNLWQMIRNS